MDIFSGETQVIPTLRHLLCALWVLILASAGSRSQEPHHYVFFNRDRERIAEPSFLETPAFEGAQLKYTWRELEREKGVYNFSAIGEDLAFLHSHGKKLFVQVQDVSFDTAINTLPLYIMTDTGYHGGACNQIEA